MIEAINELEIYPPIIYVTSISQILSIFYSNIKNN